MALTLVLNLVKGVLAARLNGFRRNAAANIAFTTVGRGEFSLVLATLAATAGLDGRVGPFIALYVLVLAVAGPILTTQSRRLGRWVLPERLFPPPGPPGPPGPPLEVATTPTG